MDDFYDSGVVSRIQAEADRLEAENNLLKCWRASQVDAIKELEKLLESWRDDASRHREPSDPVSDGVAATYDECADEIEALLKRHPRKQMSRR
jgi:hypothetical protein